MKIDIVPGEGNFAQGLALWQAHDPLAEELGEAHCVLAVELAEQQILVQIVQDSQQLSKIWLECLGVRFCDKGLCIC